MSSVQKNFCSLLFTFKVSPPKPSTVFHGPLFTSPLVCCSTLLPVPFPFLPSFLPLVLFYFRLTFYLDLDNDFLSSSITFIIFIFYLVHTYYVFTGRPSMQRVSGLLFGCTLCVVPFLFRLPTLTSFP